MHFARVTVTVCMNGALQLDLAVCASSSFLHTHPDVFLEYRCGTFYNRTRTAVLKVEQSKDANQNAAEEEDEKPGNAE